MEPRGFEPLTSAVQMPARDFADVRSCALIRLYGAIRDKWTPSLFAGVPARHCRVTVRSAVHISARFGIRLLWAPCRNAPLGRVRDTLRDENGAEMVSQLQGRSEPQRHPQWWYGHRHRGNRHDREVRSRVPLKAFAEGLAGRDFSKNTWPFFSPVSLCVPGISAKEPGLHGSGPFEGAYIRGMLS